MVQNNIKYLAKEIYYNNPYIKAEFNGKHSTFIKIDESNYVTVYSRYVDEEIDQLCDYLLELSSEELEKIWFKLM